MRFISHLDLMRLFQRASRRACLPVAITKGFSPHLKISVLNALKLGRESQAEEAVFDMSAPVEPGLFIESMNNMLPAGVRIKEAKETG